MEVAMRYVILAMILGAKAAAGDTSRDRLVVRAIVEDPSVVDWTMLNNAKLVAADILQQAEVELKWSRGNRQPGCGERLIAITFSARTPDSLLPGAMAYALPYSNGGVRIAVFLDRLRPLFARTPNSRGSILGHVMAHELVHVLQGVARHADRGLMKKRWSEDDIQQMAVKPLELTAVDLQLIGTGMTRCSTLVEE
jgi:hypothetical protein